MCLLRQKLFLVLCIFVALCNDSICETNDNKNAENDKPEPTEKSEMEPTEALPDELATEMEKVLDKEISDAESSSPEEEDEVVDKVEDAIFAETDFEKLPRPVQLLNKIFAKIEKEIAEKKDEDFKTEESFDNEKKKEEVFSLLQNIYAGRGTVSQENFDKFWRQKEKKQGEKFPYMIEKLIAVLKDFGYGSSIEEKKTTVESKVVEHTTEKLPSTEPNTIEEEKPEVAPKDTFAVWNSKDKICVLARFHAEIVIFYSSESGEQDLQVMLPKTAHYSGKCESDKQTPLLLLSWEKFSLHLVFNKTSEDNWAVTSVTLMYDTSEKAFDGATNAGKMTARSKNLNLFESPIGQSYYCPGRETILLYNGEKQVAIAKFSEIHMQPYEINDGKFSEKYHCTQVILEGPDPFVINETIPLAVGSTLALITLIILVGFSIHRAYHAAKVDYNSMG